MEHLSLEIFDLATAENKNPTTSKYATLPEDASITITDTSEIFASGDVWSYSFTLNAAANAHIIGSAAEVHGSRVHDQLNKRRARLWVDGLPMYLGYLKLDDEAEVDADGNIDVTFERGQKTFDDLIDGAKANQVPLLSDVLIGVALWRKRWVSFTANMKASVNLLQSLGANLTLSGDVKLNDSTDIPFVADGEDDPVQEYPAMVFPKGDFTLKNSAGIVEHVDRLNTDVPYDDAHPYCNVALCYQKQGYDRKMEDGSIHPDYSQEPEAQRGYEVMPANRVNSAPNFYVIYWLRCLMKHLGIYIEENQMMDVEDLRRLFFVNSKCSYREPKYIRKSTPSGMNVYEFPGNGSRRLVPERVETLKIINKEKSGFTAKITGTDAGAGDTVQNLKVEVTDAKWTDTAAYRRNNNYLHDAFATSECFPDVDISEVITAIENGFGVRLLFSDDYQRVRIVLLRNIFRSSDVQNIDCEIVGGDVKVENNIRGFRMTYGKGSDDTHFYYKGFADKLPHMKTLWPDTSDKHDYSHWDLDADYASVLHKVSAFNKTCYVTPENGNAYGIKVDKDAKYYDELHPSLFEYGGFMDAEDGDCTGEEETIEEINMGFTPAIMNDVNFEQERNATDDDEKKQRFALFVDETMRPRRPDLEDLTAPASYNDPDAFYDVDGELYGKTEGGDAKHPGMRAEDGVVKPGEFAITSDMSVSKTGLTAFLTTSIVHTSITMNVDFDITGGHISEGYRLYLQDNFEPNDDGVAPVEKHDWGLTLGIMRGSGSDANVVYEFDPEDMEGNDTWHLESGSSTVAHPDTCDCYGKPFDYTANGQDDEQDMTGRFSLKLRAEKPNPYFDAKQPESAENKRYLDITDAKLRHRGLCDQFYKEYSYWIRNARIVKRTVHMELAQFLAIDKTKKVTVGDVTGFIRKTQFTVSKETGLGMVTMEIMYI